MRVAIPVWQGRIAPVFDVARQVAVYTVVDGAVTALARRPLDTAGRAAALRTLGVEVLICSAISRSLGSVLVSAGIEVVGDVCGPVEEIVAAYAHGTLGDGRYASPGHTRLPGHGRDTLRGRLEREGRRWESFSPGDAAHRGPSRPAAATEGPVNRGDGERGDRLGAGDGPPDRR